MCLNQQSNDENKLSYSFGDEEIDNNEKRLSKTESKISNKM